jgi:hypothetical protein
MPSATRPTDASQRNFFITVPSVATACFVEFATDYRRLGVKYRDFDATVFFNVVLPALPISKTAGLQVCTTRPNAHRRPFTGWLGFVLDSKDDAAVGLVQIFGQD